MKQLSIHLFVLVFVGLCLFACNGQQNRKASIVDTEIEDCAWLIEDICHGIKRNPRELVKEHSSIGQLNIATWLSLGDLATQSDVYPQLVEKRRRRWKLLQQGFSAECIESRNDGFLSLSTSASALQKQIFQQAINDENMQRLSIDRLILRYAGLEARSARGIALQTALVQARVELDRQALATADPQE